MKISGYILIILFSLIAATEMGAQEKWDQKAAHFLIDSLILKKQPTRPKKAVLLSAVFPGAGQIYNRQYYKLHIVYGAIGGMIYAIDFNTRGFKKFDQVYRNRLAGIDTPEFPVGLIPDSSIANRRSDFRKSRETSYFGLGILYILNIADAFVSSHLTTFDIKDDLITARPKFLDTMELTGQPFPSIGFTVDF